MSIVAGAGNPIGDANATFAATLVDEWIRCGVRHAVIAPGSRSTPLAIAIAERDELSVEVVHDERVAGFVALGLGLDGVPAVVLCTSGTAAANLHPAVVEAGLSDVAMIVATADRPPELRGVGAPQTIDQIELFGRAVRWFHDAVPPDASDPASWRPLAQRVHAAAATGPVHLNLPFREPLVGRVAAMPEAIGPGLPVPRAIASSGPLTAALDVQRGVIVAGGRSGVEVAVTDALAVRLGWPILADPTSGLRAASNAVAHFDQMLRHADFARAHAPELVVRVGRPPASKVLTQWIVGSGAPVVQIGGPGVVDPDHNVVATCQPADLDGLRGAAGTPWMARWRHADDVARAAIGAELERDERDGVLTEPAVARCIAGSLASEAAADMCVVVASSMPIRDLEWFGGASARAHANRGANGIDGTMSTALGLALGGRAVIAWVGDIAFLHDSNALIAIAAAGADVRVVVTDNQGGGIFSFLPQASALSTERFEQLFGTPHHSDLVALALAHGVTATTVASVGELAAEIREPGPRVVRVATDRIDNVTVHRRLEAAVVAALR